MGEYKHKMKRIPLSKVEKFHRNKAKIKQIILSQTEPHETIHGATSVNKQLYPNFLDKPTRDIDIFSKTPKKDARETEKALDKSFGGDYFNVKPARHEGTFKVKSNITGETYADYTKPKRKIKKIKIAGFNYTTLDFTKQQVKRTLKDPESEYRHEQDRDTINRILIHEKLKQIKKRRKPK